MQKMEDKYNKNRSEELDELEIKIKTKDKELDGYLYR